MRGRKVLVTGSCGFIGSHLVERLVELEARVRAFVYYNSFNRWGWLDILPDETVRQVEVITGDIRDFNCVRTAMDKVEVVFHLAALIGIPYSYIAPESYVDTNVKGTLNVLQAARDAVVSKVIHTSTSEVYGTAKYVPIDEEHPLQAQSPYSATKIAADKLAESFHASYDLPIAICRPFNTYGPRQSARAIIPTIISQMIIQKGRIQLGNTDTTRDFNYVTDIVEGFIKIAESEKTIGEVVNIGFGSEISIGRLAQKIAGLCGFELEIVNDIKRIRPPSSEVHRLCANNDKAKDLVGWEPEVDIDKGLVRTTEWFKTNGYKYRQREYNI